MEDAPPFPHPSTPPGGGLFPSPPPPSWNAASYPQDATPYRGFPGWTPPPPLARPGRPRRFRPIEIAASAAIAGLLDVAIWGPSTLAGHEPSPVLGGFGLALLFVAVPVVLLVAARRFRRSWRLAGITGGLVLVALRSVDEPSVSLLASGVLLLGAFALGLRARRLNVPDALQATLASALRFPSKVASFAGGIAALGRRTRVGSRFGRSTVLPIVIPAGLAVLFLGVFALANPVVAHGVNLAFTALGSVLAIPSAGRLLLWTVALAAAVALLRPACCFVTATATENATASGEATPTSLLVARNALSCLNAIFLGYNLLDARYLWTGAPPAGMRTQQYAHEGAFWLTVALLLVTAVASVMFRGALAHDARGARSRTLAFVWLAQGAILGLGTYRRIAIHIARSGLSDLRIVGILGTTLVLSGVLLVAIKLHRGKSFTWLLRRQLDAFVVTGVLYALAPTHLVSATVNVARIEGGEIRPILHVFRQSRETESAAVFVPLLDHPDVRIRQGVAALLGEERTRLRGTIAQRGSWREADLGSARALRALVEASPRIDQALDGTDADDARRVLFELSRTANAD